MALLLRKQFANVEACRSHLDQGIDIQRMLVPELVTSSAVCTVKYNCKKKQKATSSIYFLHKNSRFHYLRPSWAYDTIDRCREILTESTVNNIRTKFCFHSMWPTTDTTYVRIHRVHGNLSYSTIYKSKFVTHLLFPITKLPCHYSRSII